VIRRSSRVDQLQAAAQGPWLFLHQHVEKGPALGMAHQGPSPASGTAKPGVSFQQRTEREELALSFQGGGQKPEPVRVYLANSLPESVFLGDLEPNRVDEIVLFSRELLDLETDSVYVFPMCRPDFEGVRILGQGFDRKLVADKVLTKVI
jgi:CRISPR/Cas system-associated endoribonuclease Cas2